ncbi:hypothetical protein CPT_Metamorpho_227 [Klebsiella phage Metamorpho]|nr:hypothetical protein CPT_Metamorpho_227 [Klebsiella phage Metamorpho]
MSNTCISKSIKVKLLDLSELHRQVKNIFKDHGISVGDIIEFSDGYYEDEIDGMAWKRVTLTDANTNETHIYHADNIVGIFAFCTSYCVKESSKDVYSSYSLI